MSEESTSPEIQPASNDKAVVVGLFGISGSGKTSLLNQLKTELGENEFAFYDGSKMIADVVPGGLAAFQGLEETKKRQWRERAIEKIERDCVNSRQVAVVAAQFMLWSEEHQTGQPVCTQKDLDTYTYILYLDVPVDMIAERRRDDIERSRPPLSTAHLRRWQQAEKNHLRPLCRLHKILFLLLAPHLNTPTKVATLLREFQRQNEAYNVAQTKRELDKALTSRQSRLQTVLIIDADKTLAAEDTGAMFWKTVSESGQLRDSALEYALKTLFDSPLGYSYNAFRQAVLLYEEVADDKAFDSFCQGVALAVTVYPEWVFLLRRMAEHEHVGTVVVTSGLRRVWEKVLEMEGLSKTVSVIGGGRIADGFVVSAAVKGALVSHLRNFHHTYVWAFGDSPLDLDMLSKADEAIVVVGEEQSRSKSMDTVLAHAIDNDSLKARQTLLPSNASPRLDTIRLPTVQLTDHNFVDSILSTRNQQGDFRVLTATDRTATKLLQTPTRNANVFGPTLQEAHRRVGEYLATEYLADIIGLEDYTIPHVLGQDVRGYQLRHERQTLIVALMRGGLPMAEGVNQVFPTAMFLHGRDPEDIKLHDLQDQRAVVLVDSVVNSGKTVADFVQRVRELDATIRIVVLAGVAQAESFSNGSLIEQVGRRCNVTFVALRTSETKFIGKGATDTGNRLFNTTHLD